MATSTASPEQNWPGMLVDRNDWEMYAGMASGMMADLRLVPPYVREFYADMYELLPDDAPSPAACRTSQLSLLSQPQPVCHVET